MSTVRIKLDGVDVDVASDVAPLIQAFVRDSAKEISELRDSNNALTEEVNTLRADFSDLEAEKEAAEGRADGLQSVLDEGGEAGEIHLDEDNIDEILAQIPAERIDALVSARLDTLRRLAPAFDDDFVFDGIEDDELYLAAYENIFGESPDDEMSIELMRGRVEGALATLDSDDEEESLPEPASSRGDSASSDSTGRLRTALRGVQRKDGAAASDGYASKIAQDWQKPLTASRKR
jgi:FtsZ-binding cell division protein ZapB